MGYCRHWGRSTGERETGSLRALGMLVALEREYWDYKGLGALEIERDLGTGRTGTGY